MEQNFANFEMQMNSFCAMKYDKYSMMCTN